MTYTPLTQVWTTPAWLKAHQGHEVVEEERRYELGGGVEKVLKFWKCLDCKARHLYCMMG